MQQNATPPAEPDSKYDGAKILYLTYMALPLNPVTKKAMSRTAAATFAGVDRTTTMRWEKDPLFRAAVQRAQRSGMEDHKLAARAGVAALLNSAIHVYAELLRGKDTPASVRATLATKALEMLGASTVDAPAPAGADAWAMLLQQLAATPPTDEDED